MARVSVIRLAGGLPRALVVRVDPQVDETLLSFVHRLAAENRIQLGLMLSRLQLVRQLGNQSIPGFGLSLSDEEQASLAFVAGLTKETVAAMVLAAYQGSIVDLHGIGSPGRTARAVALQEWCYFSGSHFCPECLTENGGAWMLRWKLPWTFCCVKHRARLHSLCPQCMGRPVRGRADGSLTPAFHGRIPAVGHCMNAKPLGQAKRGMRSEPCGHDLRQCERLGLPDDSPVLQAQRIIDAMIGAVSTTATEGNDQTETRQFFGELRAICALAHYCARPEDFPDLDLGASQAVARHVEQRDAAQLDRLESIDGRQGLRPRSFVGVPTDATLMSALVQFALPIVQTRDANQLKLSLQLLADRVRERSSKYRWAVQEYFELSDRLKTAFHECLASHGTFDRRIGFRSASAVGAPQLGYEPRHVPQLCPASVFRKSFAQFFPRVGERFARRFCSMAVVKLLGGTWAESADALELPESMVRQANRVITLLNLQNDYERFGMALRSWARSLSSHGDKVDFAYRRDTFRKLSEVPASAWTVVCEEACIGPGREGSRSRYAAAWLWAEMTQGDWTLSPAFGGHGLKEHARDVYKAMLSGPLKHATPALIDYGLAVLAAQVKANPDAA